MKLIDFPILIFSFVTITFLIANFALPYSSTQNILTIQTLDDSKKDNIIVKNKQKQSIVESTYQIPDTQLLGLETVNFSLDSSEEIIAIQRKEISLLDVPSFEPIWTLTLNKDNLYFKAVPQPNGTDVGVIVGINYEDTGDDLTRSNTFNVISSNGSILHSRTLRDKLIGKNKFGGFLIGDFLSSPGEELLFAIIEEQESSVDKFEDTVITKLFFFETTNWTLINEEEDNFIQNANYLKDKGHFHSPFNQTDPIIVEKIEYFSLARVKVLNCSDQETPIWKSSWFNVTGITAGAINSPFNVHSEILIWLRENNRSIDAFFPVQWDVNITNLLIKNPQNGLNQTEPLNLYSTFLPNENKSVYLAWGSNGLAWRDLSNNQIIMLNQSLSIHSTLLYTNDNIIDLMAESSVNNSSIRNIILLDGTNLSVIYSLNLTGFPFKVSSLITTGYYEADESTQQPIFVLGQSYYLVKSNGYPEPGLVFITTPLSSERVEFCNLGSLTVQWQTLTQEEITNISVTTPWKTLDIPPEQSQIQFQVDTRLFERQETVKISLDVITKENKSYYHSIQVIMVPFTCQGDLWPTESVSLSYFSPISSIKGLPVIIIGSIFVTCLIVSTIYIWDQKRK
jgi:hypothetical protein